MNATINLLDLDRKALEGFFTAQGEKPFRASQVLKWLHQFGADTVDVMTNLSRSLREQLKAAACIEAPQVVTEQIGRDGTRKWLLQLAGGNCIETVFIPEPARGTLCVSSQIGCPLACSFCATGKQGFNRNLSVGEIIGQIWIAARALGQHPKGPRRITNVVMMGMGEPLLNLDNVIGAIRIMLDDFAYGLSRRRVTLSTTGIIPKIDRLKEECPVSLAVSLHAPTDALRNQLVPINRSYPLDEVLAACWRYAKATDSRITFEYVMLEGINDSLECAAQLIKRLRGRPAKVNLIPFNPFPYTCYTRSEPEVIDRFRERLLAAGIMTITRKTRGDDIDAACGQLVGKVAPRRAGHLHPITQGRGALL